MKNLINKNKFLAVCFVLMLIFGFGVWGYYNFGAVAASPSTFAPSLSDGNYENLSSGTATAIGTLNLYSDSATNVNSVTVQFNGRNGFDPDTDLAPLDPGVSAPIMIYSSETSYNNSDSPIMAPSPVQDQGGGEYTYELTPIGGADVPLDSDGRSLFIVIQTNGSPNVDHMFTVTVPQSDGVVTDDGNHALSTATVSGTYGMGNLTFFRPKLTGGSSETLSADSPVELGTLNLSSTSSTNITSITVQFDGANGFDATTDLKPVDPGVSSPLIIYSSEQSYNNGDSPIMGGSTPQDQGSGVYTVEASPIGGADMSLDSTVRSLYLVTQISSSPTAGAEFTVSVPQPDGVVTEAGNLGLAEASNSGTYSFAGSTNVNLVGYGPLNGETGLPLNVPVDIAFDSDLATAVKNNLTDYFSISPSLSGSWQYSQESWGETVYRVGFVSSEDMALDTQYTVSIDKSITDTNGYSLSVDLSSLMSGFASLTDAGSEYQFSFTTSSEDIQGGFFPPVAQAGFPQPGMKNVSTDLQDIMIHFDRENMDATTFTTDNIVLSESGGSALGGYTVSPTSGNSGYLTISNFSLDSNKTYTVSVSREVKDENGQRLLGLPVEGQDENGPFEFSFVTDSDSVTAKPTLIGSNLDSYFSEGSYINVPLGFVMFFSFDEPLNGSTVSDSTVSLKKVDTDETVSATISYRAEGNRIRIEPDSALETSTSYRVEFTTGIQSTYGQSMDENNLEFLTTGTADSTSPVLEVAEADNCGVYIWFDEPLASSTVLNKSNYTLKLRSDATDWSAVSASTAISNAVLDWSADENRLTINGLSLTPGNEFQIILNTNITDLAGNALSSSDNANIKTGYVFDAAKTPSGQCLSDLDNYNEDDFDWNTMGTEPVNVMPNTKLICNNSKWFVDIPVTYDLASGSLIKLRFPNGFDVTNAIPDSSSPINSDWTYGDDTVTFASTDPDSSETGGSPNDGVGFNGNYVIVKTDGDIMAGDYINFDLDQISNTCVPSDTDSSGYQIQIKLVDPTGAMTEALVAQPFWLNGAGTGTISGSVSGAASEGTMNVYLESPSIGLINKTVSVDDTPEAGDNQFSFSYLQPGEYKLFTDPYMDIGGTSYFGSPLPQRINLGEGETSGGNTITIATDSADAGEYSQSVKLIGDFTTDGVNDNVDIFAHSREGSFKIKTVTPGDTGPSGNTYTLYLPDGYWTVGIGKSMQKADSKMNMVMPDWQPPANQQVEISGSGNSTSKDLLTFGLGSQSLKTIKGTVVDGSGTGIANAHVFAYRPESSDGFSGSFAETGGDGSFTLKIGVNGIYKVGAQMPGLPGSKERTVEVANSNVTGITLKLKKPNYTITGKVQDKNGNNVSYAPVWAYEPSGNNHVDTMTGTNGNYVLYVDPGTWQVETDIPGMGAVQYNSTVTITDASETGINLKPDSGLTYYTVSGSISIEGSTKAYTPLRLVKYDSDGNNLGTQYSTSTGPSGNYSISVPAGIYRMDSWLQEYGEIQRTDADDYPTTRANVNATSGNVSGANISIDAVGMEEVTLNITNAGDYSGREAFVVFEEINSTTFVPTDYRKEMIIHDLSLNSSTNTKLKHGDYQVFMHVPGLGDYMPAEGGSEAATPGYFDVGLTSADSNTLSFTLPDAATGLLTIQGTVTNADTDAAIENAWVWLEKSGRSFHSGTTTNASGVYQFNVPYSEGTEYMIGAEMPGYVSATPATYTMVDEDSDLVIDSDQDFSLTSSALQITGKIYEDSNSNNSYDSGEELANGRVFAEEGSSNLVAHSPVDATGSYNLNVTAGDWTIYGASDGYEETVYSSTVTVSGSSVSGVNIDLNQDASWTPKTKNSSITPSSGGIVDDSEATGTGVKLNIPANALGNSSESGSVQISKTKSVSKTNSSKPLGFEGVDITASNSSGQSINNLDGDVQFEYIIWKSDLDALVAEIDSTSSSKLNSVNELLTMQVAYFDETKGDWNKFSSNRKAYYKADSEDDWKLYSGADDNTSDFEEFLTAVYVDETLNTADFKLVFSAHTDHFTTISVTTANSGQSGTQSSTTSRRNVPGDQSASSGEETQDEQDADVEDELEDQDEEDIEEQKDQEEDESLEPDEQKKELVERIISMEKTLPKVPEKRSMQKEVSALSEYINMVKKEPKTKADWRVVNYLAYGTTGNIIAMSQNDKKGLLGDYKEIYGYLPQNDADWHNLANMAEGVIPSRVLREEAKAIKAFVRLFGQAVEFSNPAHEKFVHSVAYRLRPDKRNVEKEKLALRLFAQKYNQLPDSGFLWSVVRAIAYSGVIADKSNDRLETKETSVVPVQPTKGRDLQKEFEAIKRFSSLGKQMPKGKTWSVVHFIAYGSTNASKQVSQKQRFDIIKDYYENYGKMPTTEAEWQIIADKFSL